MCAAILLAGLYGEYVSDWGSITYPQFPWVLIVCGAYFALGYTGKIKADESGLTYTSCLCSTQRYSWNELSIEFTTTQRRTYQNLICKCCCACDTDRDPTPSGVAVPITSAGGQLVATLTFGSHFWHGQTLEQVAARLNELKATAVGEQSKDPETGYVPPVIER
jgi:hypothetical protein